MGHPAARPGDLRKGLAVRLGRVHEILEVLADARPGHSGLHGQQVLPREQEDRARARPDFRNQKK